MGTLQRRSCNVYHSGWVDLKLSGEGEYRRLFAKLQNRELLLFLSEANAKGPKTQVEDYYSLKNACGITWRSVIRKFGRSVSQPTITITFRPHQPCKEMKLKFEDLSILKNWHRHLHCVGLLRIPNDLDDLLPGQVQHFHDIIKELQTEQHHINRPLSSPVQIPPAMLSAYESHSCENSPDKIDDKIEETVKAENPYMSMKPVPPKILSRKTSLPNLPLTKPAYSTVGRKISVIPEVDISQQNIEMLTMASNDVKTRATDRNRCNRRNKIPLLPTRQSSEPFLTGPKDNPFIVHSSSFPSEIEKPHRKSTSALPTASVLFSTMKSHPKPEKPSSLNLDALKYLSSTPDNSGTESLSNSDVNVNALCSSPSEKSSSPTIKSGAPTSASSKNSALSSSVPLIPVPISSSSAPIDFLHTPETIIPESEQKDISVSTAKLEDSSVKAYKWFVNVAINRRQAEKILDENEEFGNMLLRKREKDPTDSWSYAVSIKYDNSSFKHYLVRKNCSKGSPYFEVHLEGDDLPNISSLEGVIALFQSKSRGKFQPLKHIKSIYHSNTYDDYFPETQNKTEESAYAERLKTSSES